MNINIIDAEIKTIVEDKYRYLAFPSISVAGKDRFMLLFHEAPLREPDTQYDPDSLLAAITGHSVMDMEKDTRRVVPRFPGSGYSPGLAKLDDEKVIITDNNWFIYNWLGEHDVRIIRGHEWVTMLRGGHSIIADVSGEKPLFGKPSRISCVHYPIVECYDSPIVTDDGSILSAVDFNSNCTQLQERPWETVILKSDDTAESWHHTGSIYLEKDYPELPRLHKPSIVKLPGGDVLCLMASYGDERVLYSSVSKDNGDNWSVPVDTGIYGGFHHSLIALADGRVLVFYSTYEKPFVIYMVISEDGGRTWQAEDAWKLSDESESDDYGWARGMEIGPSEIFITYYKHSASGSRVIRGARFRI
ncbi:MAG TPA: sialidase family protein [bacterium]|nr:sialidase family protein [bacterium]